MRTRIERAFRDWADRSTGVGLLARRLRRAIDRGTHGGSRVANVAMLHAGRCGSSVIADMLQQRPDFRWVGEPFENMKPVYYRMGARHRARHVIGNAMYRVPCAYFGFDSKILPEQHLSPALADKTPAQYVDLLLDLGFTHFILLDRRHHLRRAVSVAIGERTGIWNSFQPTATAERVRLDPARFVSYGKTLTLFEYFATLEAAHRAFRELLQGQRLLELNYEDDVETDPGVAYRRVAEFLALPSHAVSVRLRKLNPQPLASLVDNYDEIAALLRGTAYEWMLA
jgi:LPS sulfotransferase NodH